VTQYLEQKKKEFQTKSKKPIEEDSIEYMISKGESSVLTKKIEGTSFLRSQKNYKDSEEVKGEQGNSELEEDEKRLCQDLSISPESFRHLKDKIISEAEKQGKLNRSDIVKLPEEYSKRMEKEKMMTVFDFLVKKEKAIAK
jgi:hypothetical protein